MAPSALTTVSTAIGTSAAISGTAPTSKRGAPRISFPCFSSTRQSLPLLPSRTNSATREEQDLGCGSSWLAATSASVRARRNSRRPACCRDPRQDPGVGGFIRSTANTITKAYVQTNKFLGVGPRLALEGNVPLGGRSIDYMVVWPGCTGRASLIRPSQPGDPARHHRGCVLDQVVLLI